MIISREMFNPMYALFRTSPGDRVTYTINPSSHCNPNHLSYFKFVGRVVAKAVYDNRLLECYFTRSFYKHILGKSVRYRPQRRPSDGFIQQTYLLTTTPLVVAVKIRDRTIWIFFRACTVFCFCFSSSPIADIDFLDPIFGAVTAFAPSIYIIKMTVMITNVTSLNL